MDKSAWCWLIVFVFWLAFNVGDAVYLYYYIGAKVDPVHHNIFTDPTYSFKFFEYAMDVIALGISWSNVTACGVALLVTLRGVRESRGFWSSPSLLLLSFFIILPIGIIMSILPFLGRWILPPIIIKYTWKHQCDGYPMFAVLDGRAFNSSSSDKKVVYFYEKSTNKWLYTYELTDPADGDQWYFRLHDWNTDQAIIPLDEYPTLQSIGYNFTSYALAGNCTFPASPGKFVGETTTQSCVSGTFDLGNQLSFNITSTVPLNDTANTNATDSITTILTIQDDAWTYSDAPPAVKLHLVDPETNALGQIVLRTAMSRPSDCTELEVCIAAIGGREGSLVSAEIMAPLGVILMKQSDYAIQCTT